MIDYNVFYLVQHKPTGAWFPHVAKLVAENRVEYSQTNADPEFSSDPTVVKLREQLERQWHADITIQSVVEIN